MKKKVTTLFVILMTFCMLSGCGHEHTWTEATCTTPKTCSECGETEGAPAGHVWMAATCTKPKTCSVCGETEGEAAGHKWEEATCTTPKKCSVCGQTEGEAVGHIWEEATCKTPRTCITCGQTDGKLGEHQLDSTGKCKVCNSQVGEKITLDNYSKYFSVSAKGIGLECKSSGSNYIYNYKVLINAEPKRDVEFHDVYVKYTWYHNSVIKKTVNGKKVDAFSDTTTISKLDKYGDCTDNRTLYVGTFTNVGASNTAVFSSWKVTEVGGYVLK
ncbi:MAG: hypothetical protein ACI4EJ_02020 [Bacteroides sp.]